jgi:hypothetical protein
MCCALIFRTGKGKKKHGEFRVYSAAINQAKRLKLLLMKYDYFPQSLRAKRSINHPPAGGWLIL